MFRGNLYEVIYGYSESTIPSESEENVKKLNRREDKPEMSGWIQIELSAGIPNFGQNINLKCPGESESNYLRVFRIFALDRVRATEGPGTVERCKMAALGSFPFLLDLPLLPGFWGVSSILSFFGDGTLAAAELSAGSSRNLFFPECSSSESLAMDFVNFPLLVLGCSFLPPAFVVPSGACPNSRSFDVRNASGVSSTRGLVMPTFKSWVVGTT